MDSSSVVDPKNSIVYFPGTSVYHINICEDKKYYNFLEFACPYAEFCLHRPNYDVEIFLCFLSLTSYL